MALFIGQLVEVDVVFEPLELFKQLVKVVDADGDCGESGGVCRTSSGIMRFA